MFISIFDIFKIGIGPSSSHTMGPMVAARRFIGEFARREKEQNALSEQQSVARIRCLLKGSLAFTGHGHATDKAVLLGIHGYHPADLIETDIPGLLQTLERPTPIVSLAPLKIAFNPQEDIVFDYDNPLPQHPNAMVIEALNAQGHPLFSETYFSIGGGFISTLAEIDSIQAPIKGEPAAHSPYPFNSSESMLKMALDNRLTIAEMKRSNEQQHLSPLIDEKIQHIWLAMRRCVESGLQAEGILPGGLKVKRRAKNLYQQLIKHDSNANVNDWLCAYAMSVNEENAAGHMVVTAPTNGAAGVIPAVLYYLVQHENADDRQIQDFLLTAAAIGGLIKHRSSISGAEVGCQGEVGSASAMAAAGLCAAKGGSPQQIEQAAEMALEHHLGMTCDPVKGLVQIPCIERNGFGAIKAYTAASIALREKGENLMSLDSCIAAMKTTGEEMSHKYKETSLGGLAVTWVEC
ncbi:L-serine ammonia-lyase [Thiomicrorhabdus sp. 6S3-12]|uniref:L-serine ammonia-lyase n=1 Tax=Thiomicrorhabdus sp. 6S3-12 TaxID=2819681 RepID=UPI001AAC69AD|nr:L-serine ammonia-lyase [Thiomicrorhabdus sp. 6S3-12]MBO1925071.1 L-serine ammonia-lyase [Thiomicrorhabdus sp. 6S3-12]